MNIEDNDNKLFPIRESLMQNLLWITGIAVIYFIIARSNLFVMLKPEGIAAIWPASGIFLSALILTRRYLHIYLILVLFFIDLIVNITTGIPLIISFIYALAIMGDALLSFWLLFRFFKGTINFNRTRDIFGFLIFSIILTNSLTSLITAAAAYFLHGTSFINSWIWWFSSDGIGNIIAVPFLVSWAFWIRSGLMNLKLKLKRIFEGVILLVLLAFLNFIIFGFALKNNQFLFLTYLSFPFLIWAALRFGVRGASLASLILAVIAIYFTAFNKDTHIILIYNFKLDIVITVELYLAIMAVPSLILAAVVTERQEVEQSLAQERNMLRTLIDAIPDNIYIKDTASRFLACNMALARSMGKSKLEHIYNKTDFDFHPAEFARKYFADEREIFNTGKPLISHEEFAFNAYTNRLEYVITTKIPLRDQQGNIYGLVGISRDITERRQIEEKLKMAHDRLNLAAHAARIGVWDWDIQKNVMIWDDQMYKLYGIDKKDFGGVFLSWINYLHPDDKSQQDDNIKQTLRGEVEYDSEFRIIWADGSIHFIKSYGHLTRDNKGQPLRLTGINFDITESKHFEDKIQNLLNEKELILNEVHHRIKNNMNTILSLLTIQANVQNNPDIKSILLDAAARIQSMRVLYDKLYRTENVKAVSIKEYFPSLINEIFNIFPQKGSIKINTQIEDIILKSNILSPLGIIINELITNSMKYAFTDRNEGSININVSKKENRISIIFEDNGNGLPLTFSFEKNKGFGLYLVNMMVKQLNGSLTIEKHKGTKFLIEFIV